MKHLEVEFKYRADDISLEKFTELCKNRGEHKFVEASGYDHFYSHPDNDDRFCRHRIGPDLNQLTFKRKSVERNNYVRTEHNINLQKQVSRDQVQALCSEFGYKFNVSVFKTCFVYKYDRHTKVYYICYDTNMKELGRFIEIEMSEEHPWESEDQAKQELLELEAKLSEVLSISPQSRMRKSLFELYRK